MNININNLLIKLKSFEGTLEKYVAIISVTLIVIIYGFLVYTIGSIATIEPNEELVQEKLKGTKRLKIDQEAIDKIEKLEDQNVRVQALFKSARDNPFREN